MKKFFFAFGAIILVCVLMLSLVACNGTTKEEPLSESDAVNALASSFSMDAVNGDDANIAVTIKWYTVYAESQTAAPMMKSNDEIILYEANNDDNGKTVLLVRSRLTYDHDNDDAQSSNNTVALVGKANNTYHKYYASEKYNAGALDTEESSYTDTAIDDADLDSVIEDSTEETATIILKTLIERYTGSNATIPEDDKISGKTENGITTINIETELTFYDEEACLLTAVIKDKKLVSCNLKIVMSTTPYYVAYEFDVDIDYNSTLAMPSTIDGIKNKYHPVGSLYYTEEYIKATTAALNKQLNLAAQTTTRGVANTISTMIVAEEEPFDDYPCDFASFTETQKQQVVTELETQLQREFYLTKAGNEDNLLAGTECGFLLTFTSQGISVTCIMYGDTTKQLGYIVSNEGTVTDISDEIPE